jgi:sec-independent protein translocase protein TatA
LAIDSYEAITIVLIVAVIFLWGPQKLPEIAKMIGEARKEYEKASREIPSLTSLPLGAGSQATAKTKQDPVLIAAKSLGITTEGKTKEQLASEIVSRTAKKEPSLPSVPAKNETAPATPTTPTT